MHKPLLTATATVLALGLTTGAAAAETAVKLEGCEFSITLPDSPDVSEGRPAAPGTPAAGPSQVALLRGTIPAFRVECQPLSRLPPEAEANAALFDNMLDVAQTMNLTSLITERGENRVGRWAKFTGNQVQAGAKLVVTGTFYLGRRSIMSVVATEGARTFPSEAVTRVFDSVRR